VLSGLTGSERVVANPGEQLVEGIKVRPQTNAPDAKGAKDAAPAGGKDKE
jgi:hypothetical protein